MTAQLLFDFIADKEKHTLYIKREFSAGRQRVWDCYTKSELLEQWLAPKPYTLKTKSMDFREGGHWLYAMISPEGKSFWSRTDYLKIIPIESYNAIDGFCDESGQINTDLPRAEWVVGFEESSNTTLVNITIKYASLSDLDTVLKMGMQEGFTMSLNQLEQLLATI